jgi:hypothetical protein
MKKNQIKLFISFSVFLFLLSILLMIMGIKDPEYGGDEVWFAVNLLYQRIIDLSLFEFVYSGPIKTILTYFIFKVFGFNIYSVRCFSIAVYVLGIAIWSGYLIKNKLWIALSASLIVFSLSADLLFFAKVDINQPTFHNLFFIFHIIIFLFLVKRGPVLPVSLLFILFSLIESNLHIRNIWIMNAFVFAFAIDYLLFINRNLFSLATMKQFLRRAWPILTGWTLSSFYFIYTIVHFRSDPLVLMATAPGEKISLYDSVTRAIYNLSHYVVGGRVFANAYATRSEVVLTTVTGSVFLIISIILFIVLFRKLKLTNNSWYMRLVTIILCLTVFIFIQYAVTKSSIQPWHGNHLFLLSALLTGLLFEGLLLINLKPIAFTFLISLAVALASIQYHVSQQVRTMSETRHGFELVVWQPIKLTAIRSYMRNFPDTYVLADWEMGRPLALEYHYNSHNGSNIEFITSGLSAELISGLNNKLIIRSTFITRTVPDWSDEEFSKFNAEFEKVHDFRDIFGRAVYQLGYVRKRE